MIGRTGVSAAAYTVDWDTRKARKKLWSVSLPPYFSGLSGARQDR